MTLEEATRLAELHVDKTGRFWTSGSWRYGSTLIGAKPTAGGFCFTYQSEPVDGGGGIDGPVLWFVMADGAVLDLVQYMSHPDSE